MNVGLSFTENKSAKAQITFRLGKIKIIGHFLIFSKTKNLFQQIVIIFYNVLPNT